MKKEVWVISLGGSRIVPGEKIDYKFLRDFKKLVDRHKSKKFVVITGGGAVAREYILGLRELHKSEKKQSLLGISVTRLNAFLMTEIFGKEANEILPKDMKDVKNMLKKNQVVFCGALRYREKNTSDGTAASLAAFLHASFINLTNVPGLFDKNPKTHKSAKLIKGISWKGFNDMARKIKFKAGQHFALDQNAAITIMKEKIPTFIVGSVEDIENIITNKKYAGSLIYG